MARPIQTDVVVGWYATPGSIVVWAGESHPGPNPKPDVQVSKHPAFQTVLIPWNASALGRTPSQSVAAGAYASDVAETVPTIFFGPLPRSSRTLPISEPFRCPKRHILPPFAMWLAFPASDYYGGSATRPPRR